MTQVEISDSPIETLRSALRDLARHRARPCLAVIGEIDRPAVRSVLDAIDGLATPAIDIVVSGPGGDIEAAYLVARTLRRRFPIAAAYVPSLAKSAATMLCLAADEIVLAELGELGPLDAQSPAGSALAPFKLLEQIADAVAQGLRRNRAALQTGSVGSPGNQAAAEVAGAVIRSALSPMEALRLAEAARSLEEAQAFCERLFRRYRPDVHAGSESIVHRLIHQYPCHGFPIDLEELHELGLPARPAHDTEAAVLGRMAGVLVNLSDELRLIEVAVPEEIAQADSPRANGHDGESEAA